MNFKPWLVFKLTIAQQNETALLVQQANREDQSKAGSSGQEVKHGLTFSAIKRSVIWKCTLVCHIHQSASLWCDPQR